MSKLVTIESLKKEIKLFVDVGTYEKKVGATFLPDKETNFSEGNIRLKKVLEEKLESSRKELELSQTC